MSDAAQASAGRRPERRKQSSPANGSARDDREASADKSAANADSGLEDDVSSNVGFGVDSQRRGKGAKGRDGPEGAADAEGEEEEAGRQITIDPTKDLWANITLNVKDNNQEVTEVSLLVVGGAGSGKTSLLHRIYSSTDGGGGKGGGKRVKPTTALDYSFARRSDRNFSQVAHFWELAQNRQLSALADIILSPENIHAVVCAVVVDLFSAEDAGVSSGAADGVGAAKDSEAVFHTLSAWDTAVYWLKKIDSRSAEVLEKMRAKNSSTPAKLLSRAHKFCGGQENPDLKRMRLSGLPTVLVVNKMDLFFKHVYNGAAVNYNKDNFSLLVKAFRFLAHLYGCHLIFTAAAPESGAAAGGGKTSSSSGGAVYHSEGVNKWRNTMSHLLFQTPFESKYVNMDLEKDGGAILVTADKESFLDIGEPNGGNYVKPTAGAAGGGADGPSGTAGDAELERWRGALDAAFPLPEHAQQQMQQRGRRGVGGSPAGASGPEFTKALFETYAEPAVDALRRQKDEELEQYRKASRLKAKEGR